MRTRISLILIAAACMAPRAAVAQIRAGGEFQVNLSTLGDQLSPGVSVGGTGDFVVVWSSAAEDGIFGRRYDAAGIPAGGEFRVDASTTIAKSTPTVASDGHGKFVVAWTHSSPNSIRGRRFDAAGQPLGAESVFSSNTFSGVREPRLAAGLDGWFLLSYLDYGVQPLARGFGFDLFNPEGGFYCGFNSNAGANSGAAATIRPDFSWAGVTANSPVGLEVRHFGGVPCTFGSPAPVTSPGPASPAIDSDADGNSVLAWMSVADGDQSGIRGRRLDAFSNPQGAEFQVNGYTTGAQTNPSVAVAADGTFVVAWQSTAGDGSAEAVFARRFRADGSPRENDFVVNTHTTGAQRTPIAATDSSGNFVVAWESAGGQDGDGVGVFAQRFGGLTATAMSVDATGNWVLEPGETVAIAPSWRNVNGAPRSFSGSATSFSGPGTPGNPSYVLSDAIADYGSVANGATASCADTGDCFEVAVTVPAPRPALHWDARLREEISPVGFGQSHVWSVHVGDSFTDVARTNPFYRFVETLLHHRVTGGCAGSSYCPAASVTREQMAVFVLVAREGFGYGSNPFFPQPCSGTPPFGDVPMGSPFCRFIQELARRSVVGGCGGGNYCPGNPVSREQMAVFVLATLEGPTYSPPPCTTPPFADVPVTSPFCPWVRELANRGVVSGCGGGNYCPTAPVTREQMGVFLSVTFGLQLYGP